MARGPTYTAILAAHKEAALLAQSVLRALVADRANTYSHRLDCMIAAEALQDAVDMAASRQIPKPPTRATCCENAPFCECDAVDCVPTLEPAQ